MIDKSEIKAKREVFGCDAASIERDYVFGWLLQGIFSKSVLGERLALKGGNLFRKAYFPNSRLSKDLDFSILTPLDIQETINELNDICDFIEDETGIEFDTRHNKIEEKRSVRSRDEPEKHSYNARLYFRDFAGKPTSMNLKATLDFSQMSKVLLPVQKRPLLHDYSDADKCSGTISCMKIEEGLADKFKCLIQRRHVADLFDVLQPLSSKSVPIDANEVVDTLLRKTIFRPAPSMLKKIYFALPFEVFETAWNSYIKAPSAVLCDFGDAVERFKDHVHDLFGKFPETHRELLFFPVEVRNRIIGAGHDQHMMKIRYDGATRTIEPYSLSFKVRKDGLGREYFYAYDLTGGQTSGPGIKTFLHEKIEYLEELGDSFVPRYEVELSKAGEFGKRPYFPRTRRRFVFGNRIRRRRPGRRRRR